MILTEQLIKKIIIPRVRDCNKGDFGKLLSVTSCRAMTGASVLSASAALKCGVGLVAVASAESALLPLKVALPEAITLPLNETENGKILKDEANKILEYSKNCSALLIGCGLSVCENTRQLVFSLLQNADIPVILDADGINIISENINILRSRKAPTILTPHLKEMSRLTKKSVSEIKQNKISVATEFASENNCIVILKDFETVIAAPDKSYYVNKGGHPCMAKGGSGDVLAGMVASFVAQGKTCLDSSLAAVFIHSRCGEICGSEMGDHSPLAIDLINALPRVFCSLK